MIPKIIHYCWFGGKPLPRLAKKCIRSWKKYCPDWQIQRWDESNYDLAAAPVYVRQAYEAKKWAFVTDYVRLQVVYEYGGIYLDTDVELVRSPMELLTHHAFFGFEGGPYVATGLGFGAEKGAPILAEMMDDYIDIPFVKEDGSFDVTACPVRNTQVLVRHGMKADHTEQILDGGIRILPRSWLCPFDDWKDELAIKPETVSIHWYSASWETKEYKKAKNAAVRAKRRTDRKEHWRYLPNRVARKLLGDRLIDQLKGKMGK